MRAVADGDERTRHFLGSILCSSPSAVVPDDGLVLIDGQQRITTLMLLVAAMRHTVAAADPGFAAALDRVLVDPSDPSRTKLRPHRAWADLYESVVLDRQDDVAAGSRFEENYTYFRSQVGPDEVPRVWRGLQRLEHVAITLGPDANAQQIFESLNSTGAPLRDHELIHNYVLMGLTHAEQSSIEDEYWAPIEQATGEQIGAFVRDLIVLTTGIEPVLEERAVYDAFGASIRGSTSRSSAHGRRSGSSSRRSTASCSTRPRRPTPTSARGSGISGPSARRCTRSSCSRSGIGDAATSGSRSCSRRSPSSSPCCCAG